MDGNVAEHVVFHDGLVSYKTYLEGVLAQRESFDGAKLKDIMDGFVPDLTRHLHNEIDSLVGMVSYEDKCDWAGWFKGRMGAMIRGQMQDGQFRVSCCLVLHVASCADGCCVVLQTTMAPMVLIFHDKSFMDGVWADFPSIPWLARVVMGFLWLRKHVAWWRFAGCDLSSNRQDLPFA
jgi:hypothetical protein